MKNQRLLELDALRGIAALAVVCFHYFAHYNDIYVHKNIPVKWSYIGQYGVELFFIVSGFVIFWTLNKIKNPLDFIISRFSRLYPAYWFAIGVSFSTVSYFGLTGREVSAIDALANLLMFHQYFGIPHVDQVYWTLTIELTFYFWMLMLYICSALNKIEYIFIGLITLSLLHSLQILNIPDFIYQFLILNYVPFFMAGICFYKLINGYEHLRTTLGILLLSLLSTLVIFSFKPFLLFTLFYVIFYLSLSGRMKFLAIKPLVFIGNISYALYLLHQNIGYIIINQFYTLHWNPWVGILSAFILSIFLAIFSSKYLEISLLKYIRSRYNKTQKS